MADMKCNTCSEPWDWFHIRDEVLADQPLYEKMKDHGGYVRETEDWEYQEYHPSSILTTSRSAVMPKKGDDLKDHPFPPDVKWHFIPGPYIQACPACFGKAIEPDDNAKIRAALQDLLGDDIDGFISEMEDFGL